MISNGLSTIDCDIYGIKVGSTHANSDYIGVAYKDHNRELLTLSQVDALIIALAAARKRAEANIGKGKFNAPTPTNTREAYAILGKIAAKLGIS